MLNEDARNRDHQRYYRYNGPEDLPFLLSSGEQEDQCTKERGDGEARPENLCCHVDPFGNADDRLL